MNIQNDVPKKDRFYAHLIFLCMTIWVAVIFMRMQGMSINQINDAIQSGLLIYLTAKQLSRKAQ